VIYSAHDLCTTRLCQAASCENDAENNRDLCAKCERRRLRLGRITLHEEPERPRDRHKPRPPRSELPADQQEHLRVQDRDRRARELQRKLNERERKT
jgi:hypothetical protein